MPDSSAPQDPVGTVRVEHLGRAIAVRGYIDSEPTWYVIDTTPQGGWVFEMPDVSGWPIVFGGDA